MKTYARSCFPLQTLTRTSKGQAQGDAYGDPARRDGIGGLSAVSAPHVLPTTAAQQISFTETIPSISLTLAIFKMHHI